MEFAERHGRFAAGRPPGRKAGFEVGEESGELRRGGAGGSTKNCRAGIVGANIVGRVVDRPRRAAWDWGPLRIESF